MTIEEILNHDTEFKYMLLGRLQHDLDSKTTSLWGITLQNHINTLEAIWNNLDVKPEWLTQEQLNEYKELLNNEPK